MHLKTRDGRDTGPAWIEVHWPEPDLFNLDAALVDSFGTIDVKATAEKMVRQQFKKN